MVSFINDTIDRKYSNTKYSDILFALQHPEHRKINKSIALNIAFQRCKPRIRNIPYHFGMIDLSTYHKRGHKKSLLRAAVNESFQTSSVHNISPDKKPLNHPPSRRNYNFFPLPLEMLNSLDTEAQKKKLGQDIAASSTFSTRHVSRLAARSPPISNGKEWTSWKNESRLSASLSHFFTPFFPHSSHRFSLEFHGGYIARSVLQLSIPLSFPFHSR